MPEMRVRLCDTTTEANVAYCAWRVRSANQSRESAAPSQAELFHGRLKGRSKKNKLRQIDSLSDGRPAPFKTRQRTQSGGWKGAKKTYWFHESIVEIPARWVTAGIPTGSTCVRLWKKCSQKITGCAACLSQHTCVCSCSACVKMLLMCGAVPKTITGGWGGTTKIYHTAEQFQWKLAWRLLFQNKDAVIVCTFRTWEQVCDFCRLNTEETHAHKQLSHSKRCVTFAILKNYREICSQIMARMQWKPIFQFQVLRRKGFHWMQDTSNKMGAGMFSWTDRLLFSAFRALGGSNWQKNWKSTRRHPHGMLLFRQIKLADQNLKWKQDVL